MSALGIVALALFCGAGVVLGFAWIRAELRIREGRRQLAEVIRRNMRGRF